MTQARPGNSLQTFDPIDSFALRTSRNRRNALKLMGVSALVGMAPNVAFGQGKRGGTLVIGVTSDVNPTEILAQTQGDIPLIHQIFNTLIRYDHKTLEPKPELARSWTIAPDRMSLTMQLRDGVKFHSGRALNASDVVQSITRTQDPAYSAQLRTIARTIGEAKALSPLELRITLAEPIPPENLFDLFELMPIIDHETMPIRNQAGNVRMVGTGPFVWGEWKPGESLTLTRNPNYWKPNLPYLDGIRYTVQPRIPSLVSSIQAGQTHMAVRLVPSSVQSVKNDPSVALTFSETPVQAWYVGCNVKIAPLDKKQVRQAISFAIDRDRIMRLLFDGKGNPGALPWPTYSPAYDKSLEAQHAYNPAKAKQLLAGIAPNELEVTMMVDSTEAASAGMAQVIQYNLEQVGFKVKPVGTTYADLAGRLIAGTFPGLWIQGHTFIQMHPGTLPTSAFPMNASRNASNFESDDYKRIAKEALLAPPAKAKEAYDKLNRFLLDERFVINIGSSPAMVVHSKRLSGLKFDMITWNILEEASLA